MNHIRNQEQRIKRLELENIVVTKKLVELTEEDYQDEDKKKIIDQEFADELKDKIMELKQELDDMLDYKSRYEAQVQETEECLSSLSFYQEQNKELKQDNKKLKEKLSRNGIPWEDEWGPESPDSDDE